MIGRFKKKKREILRAFALQAEDDDDDGFLVGSLAKTREN